MPAARASAPRTAPETISDRRLASENVFDRPLATTNTMATQLINSNVSQTQWTPSRSRPGSPCSGSSKTSSSSAALTTRWVLVVSVGTG